LRIGRVRKCRGKITLTFLAASAKVKSKVDRSFAEKTAAGSYGSKAAFRDGP